MITSNDAWTRILTSPGKFFYVEFRLRNPAPDGRPAGTIRKMLAKRPVNKYAKGVVTEAERNAEDTLHNVLTVWDVQKFQQLRAAGMPIMLAGWKSYRRIPMDDVVDISIPPVPNDP